MTEITHPLLEFWKGATMRILLDLCLSIFSACLPVLVILSFIWNHASDEKQHHLRAIWDAGGYWLVLVWVVVLFLFSFRMRRLMFSD